MTTKYVKANHIFDTDTKTTFAGILALTDGKITEILPVDADVDATLVTDYGDQMIIPGFIDAHQHVSKASLVYADIFQPITGTSIEEVANNVAKLTAHNGWKLATGFYSSEFESSVEPTKFDLDQVEADVPTMLVSGDGHTVWLNSKALAQITIADTDLTIYGGTAYQVDGEYTGFFEEGIAVRVESLIFDQIDLDRTTIYQRYMQYQNTMGITGTADIAATGASDDDLIYPAAYKPIADTLTMRVSMFPAMRTDTTRIEAIQTAFAGHERVQFGGVKQFYDGVTSTSTAYLKAPYPGSTTNYGGPLLANEELHTLFLKANQNGWPIRVHAIGDEAVNQTLTTFAQANAQFPLPAGKFNTIEHLEVFDQADLPLIQDTQAIVSVQPSHALIEYDSLVNEVGLERSKAMFPTKDFLDNGATLAFGTDAPVVINHTPLQSLFNATTRRTLANDPQDSFRPEQAIDTVSALIAHTQNAAKAIQRPDLGAIKVGNYADLVVLDTDILAIPATELLSVKVMATIFNGETVFENQA